MSSDAEHASRTSRRPRWVEDAERLDLAIYAAIARTPTLSLDVAMSRLSRAADYSRLSLTAAAFATGVGRILPTAAVPLHALAAAVAYSRVHFGVHHPADVLGGALIGTALAQLTTYAGERRRPARTT